MFCISFGAWCVVLLVNRTNYSMDDSKMLLFALLFILCSTQLLNHPSFSMGRRVVFAGVSFSDLPPPRPEVEHLNGEEGGGDTQEDKAYDGRVVEVVRSHGFLQG